MRKSVDPVKEARQWQMTFCLLVVVIGLAAFDILVLVVRFF
jgi:hypothetical protein